MAGKLDEHYDKWSKIAADIEDDEPSPDPGTRALPPAQTTRPTTRGRFALLP